MKVGRASNEEQHEAFLKTCSYPNTNDEEQMCIADLIAQMEEYSQGSDMQAYNRWRMKRKLIEYYGDFIIISEESGKGDMATLW